MSTGMDSLSYFDTQMGSDLTQFWCLFEKIVVYFYSVEINLVVFSDPVRHRRRTLSKKMVSSIFVNNKCCITTLVVLYQMWMKLAPRLMSLLKNCIQTISHFVCFLLHKCLIYRVLSLIDITIVCRKCHLRRLCLYLGTPQRITRTIFLHGSSRAILKRGLAYVKKSFI